MRRDPFSARSGSERVGGFLAVGLILLPLLVGGLLAWALSTPTKHLGRVTAAIVNDDVPVTVNGKSVPLGRQFAAGLMAGNSPDPEPTGDPTAIPTNAPSPTASPTASPGATATPTAAPAPTPSSSASVRAADSAPPADNFTWVLTNDAEAKKGLASGRYSAVLTIPATFSQDATSTSGPAEKTTQAHLQVQASPSSAFIDPALTEAITSAATTTLGRELTGQYLGNIYVGFNTINEQIGQASGSSKSLASGASSVSDGAKTLADGADSLTTGTRSLNAGAQSLSTGLATLDSSAEQLPAQTEKLAAGARSLDSGAQSLSNGLAALDSSAARLPAQTEKLAEGAAGVASGTDAAARSLAAATEGLAAVAAQACERPGVACTKATQALAGLRAASADVARLAAGADGVAAGSKALAAAMPKLVTGIGQSAAGAVQVAAGADGVAAGSKALATAMPKLVTGIGQSAAGAVQVAAGAEQVNDGATNLDDGAQNLESGASQVDSGAGQLSQGLATAVEQIPTYSNGDIQRLSSVVSEPVLVAQAASATGSQSVPLFCVVGLWLGALVLAMGRRAVPSHRLMTSASSLSIATRSVAVGALLGMAQGLVVSVFLLLGLAIEPGQRLGFIALSMVAGAAFAVLNQGLAAALGGAGRLLAAVIGMIALGVGLASTVPPVFSAISSLLPTSPALAMLRAVVAGDAFGAWAALGGCMVFAVLGWALVLAGVSSRRGAPVGQFGAHPALAD